MEHKEGTFKYPGLGELYYQGWLPEGEPKALIFVIHGLAEHGGRYLNVVNQLVPAGFGVYALDLYGHGKSDGSRVVYCNVNATVKPGESRAIVAQRLRQRIWTAFENGKIRVIPRESPNGNRLDLREDIGRHFDIAEKLLPTVK